MQRWILALLFFASIGAQAALIVLSLPDDSIGFALGVVLLAIFIVSALLLWRGSDPIVSLRAELNAQQWQILEAFAQAGGTIDSATHLAHALGVEASQENYYKMQSLVEVGLLQHREAIQLTEKGRKILRKRGAG